MNDKRVRGGPFHLLDKRERWGLTVRGYTVALIVACALVLVLVPGINGFLAIDFPVRGERWVGMLLSA